MIYKFNVQYFPTKESVKNKILLEDKLNCNIWSHNLELYYFKNICLVVFKYFYFMTYSYVYFFQSQWEKSTDKQIQKNTVKREVEKHISYENMLLEKRRERYFQQNYIMNCIWYF